MTSGADTVSRRPKRADARRNYDLLIDAARKMFTAQSTEVPLEDIARNAGVGIGTLYRHFPSRQALLEGVYREEVEALCRSADELADLPADEALEIWLRRFVTYGQTKRALATELVNTLGRESELFTACHVAIYSVADPLLKRAQQDGVIRKDVELSDVLRLVGGIAVNTAGVDDGQMAQRLLRVVLDGLRSHPAG
ncbi:MAG TPA: TetR/AcrR family transcriptional regulator [Jatrophihabitans sp.]|jgi:AcrR family transcriptional regulator